MQHRSRTKLSVCLFPYLKCVCACVYVCVYMCVCVCVCMCVLCVCVNNNQISRDRIEFSNGIFHRLKMLL